MGFWIIISLLAVVVVAQLALALLRGRPEPVPPAVHDLRVYRDQLSEVDRDLARGVLGDADAERVRAEVSRRILAADARIQHDIRGPQTTAIGSRAIAVLIGVGVVAGSLAIYWTIGTPGYGDLGQAWRIEMADQARANRPSQAAAEVDAPKPPPLSNITQDYLTLMQRLRDTVARRPDDLLGRTLLARNEALLGNFAAAYHAQGEVLRIKGDSTTAGDVADYADMMILAAGGYVSPEAEAALKRALDIDPHDGPTRYYWGLLEGQTGRPDLAFRIWNTLLRESRPQAPWVAPIRGQIEAVAAAAGVSYTLPPESALPGPSGADVAAAADLSDAERQAMIRTMVDGLSSRLKSDGGSAQEWARLIAALGVLGDTEKARAAYGKAENAYAGDEQALKPIRKAARQAGVLE